MKLGVVGYCPPPGVVNSDAFFTNLQKYPAKNPLYLLSDSAERNPSRLIKSPEMIGRRPPWALNNWLFFEALLLARDVGLAYAIYVESDSRVGCDGWDQVMFDEFFGRYPEGVAAAGTPICWDVTSGGAVFASRVIEQAYKYQQASDHPASFFSAKDPRDCSGAAYYANGSLMIMEVAAMLKIFQGFEADTMAYSKRITAFDLSLGRFLWNYHGPNAVEHVGWLASSYSAFGNCVTTEEERLAMLTDGTKCAVHQVKGAA